MINGTSKRWQGLGICVGLSLFVSLFMLPTQVQALESPPVVVTFFEFKEAENFTDLLAEYIPDLTKRVVNTLTKECSDKFKFAQWTAKTDSVSWSTAVYDAHLKLTFTGQEVVKLVYSATFQNQRKYTREWNLYGRWDEKPIYDYEELEGDILSEIKNHFNNDDFRGKLKEKFLYTIPLTTKLYTPPKKIIIPIDWGKLKARSEESILRVEFYAEPERRGAMKLSPYQPRPEGIQCWILSFFCEPIDRSGKAFWYKEIPGVLQHLVPNTLKVYMKKYVEDYDTGGDANTPE